MSFYRIVGRKAIYSGALVQLAFEPVESEFCLLVFVVVIVVR